MVFKISSDYPETYFYLRFRYKDIASDKDYNIDYPYKLDLDANQLLQESDEQTPEITDQNTPTPSVTPTLQETPEPKNEESTDEAYIEPVFNVLSKEQKENIYITEFMSAPITGESEWVEIYNNNDEEVTLTNWFIDDVIGFGGSAVSFTASISAKSYHVLDINKSLLNNSGDTVSLLDDNNNLVHSVTYEKSKSNYSIQKLSNGKWYITAKDTKGSKNLNYEEAVITVADKKEEKSNDDIPAPEIDQGDVLGVIDSNRDGNGVVCKTPANTIPYRKIPYYPMEKPFTIDSMGNGATYIVTEKDQLTYYEAFISFFKKAFW